MLVRKMVAEFVGTFALVFIGCGAIIAQSTLGGIKMTAVAKGVAAPGIAMEVNPTSYVAIAFAFGLTIMVMVYAVGHISAAHFNPAVTIGFAVAGRFPWRYVPHYLLAEFGGAFLASLVHWGLMSGEGLNVNFGATAIPPTFNLAGGFLVEIVLTFLLMFVIMAVATDKRFPSAASGLAIGLTVTICALMGGAFTGASMNPARSLAPAVFAFTADPRPLQQIWVYLLAPTIGAAIAARVYEFLRPEEFARKGAPEDLMPTTVEA
jgi:MIP family channel proteins